ncbi:hypothetical protein PILCRDRAFT_587012 [Piloderma croceum F 1598]|uniref:Uncharacterized protein n=1 Tax=Piloderma croceum (strain F 1598) TaxID=765440 RepID=A0A0C3FEK3_PILCF|nr:hypothetical protein PILCRDRAFT_587012 [Piloderma croceum F 1598]
MTQTQNQVKRSMTSQELSLTFDLTVTFPTHNKHRCLTMSSNFAWQATQHQKIKWPPHIAPYVCLKTAPAVKVKSIFGQVMTNV